MNIVEIAALLSVDSNRIGLFTQEEYGGMEALLEAKKHDNPNLTDESIASFFTALKRYSKPFQLLLDNRALYNFFAKTNLSRKKFHTEDEVINQIAVKNFIKSFLMHELNPFVLDKIHANEFQEIGPLMEAHQYLPDNISEWVIYYAIEKLDFANTTLTPPFGDFSKIGYVRDAHFYILLNGLKSEIIEEKLKMLFETIMVMYMSNKTSELAKQAFTSMQNYEAIDTGFSKKVSLYRESAEINYKPFRVNRRKYYWIYAVVALFVIVRGSMLVSDISKINTVYESNEDYNSYEDDYSAEPEIDRYYTNMRFKIDSFRVFLADYNADKIRRLTKINMKTGENPFETFYEHQPTEESTNSIRVKNSSGYDMLLLENAVVYDSIKIPRTAHFIKAGDFINVNFNSQDSESNTIFNVYMGKKLATFQTESNHLFVRGGSVVEYRFSELAPRAKVILAEDHIFTSDVNLKYKNGGLIEE